jgi:polar amino acid transport system substrate-binding protein
MMNAVRRGICAGACAAGALLLAGCAAAPDPRASAGAVAELGATGRLRAAINFGNPILASRSANGDAQGVSVDLAREAARRLGLPVELVLFNSAGSVVEALKARQVDLAFVAIDPVRAADMDYTLVRAPTSPAVTDLFVAQHLEVAAGVKQQLRADATRVGGLRLLPGRFMVIEQAMAVPKGRLAAQAWLSGFVEEMKSSGFVAAALQRHGIEGAAVAQRARP